MRAMDLVVQDVTTGTLLERQLASVHGQHLSVEGSGYPCWVWSRAAYP